MPTYKIANRDPISKTRFYLKDTDTSSTVWTDQEISFMLDEAGGNPKLAAALGLEAEASDQARSSAIIRLGNFGDNEKSAYDAMLEHAKYLRKTTLIAPSINPPNRVFQLPNDSSAIAGNMDPW